MQMQFAGDSHWFLRHSTGIILDPTADQFSTPPASEDYSKARGRGFLTKRPSKRAADLMRRMVFQ